MNKIKIKNIMTIEEKAMAYDEAIGKAQNILHTSEFIKITDLFPNLVESEDERIRKTLIDALKTSKSVGELKFILPEPTRKDCIAYLEKQKDLDKIIVVSPEVWDKAIADAYENGKKEAEKQKEQKPAEKQDYSGLNDLEKAIYRGFLAAGVENVPVKIIKETAKDCLVQTGLIRWELPEDFEEAVFNVVNFMSPFSSEDELREISHRFAKQLLSLAKEEVQKPTWSEDDENMFNEILENYKLRIYLCKSEIEWIESLKHRIQLQPKQEWSEEDIKKIRSEEYTKGFNDAAFGGKLKEWNVDDEDKIRQIERIAQQAGCTQKLQEEIHDWLKSLRPQSHSEDDKKDDKPINCDLQDIDDDFQGLNSEAICKSYKGDCMNCPHNRIKNKNKSLQSNSEWRHYIWAINMRFDYTALIKYDNTNDYEIVQAGNRPKQEKNGVYILIKDIKPQPSWKPTEEQMEALARATNRCVGVKDAHILLTMLNDINKL